MTARAVHWNEGMFLRPHHLQAAQRYASAHLHRSSLFDQHYNWGLRSLDIDKEALANAQTQADQVMRAAGYY